MRPAGDDGMAACGNDGVKTVVISGKKGIKVFSLGIFGESKVKGKQGPNCLKLTVVIGLYVFGLNFVTLGVFLLLFEFLGPSKPWSKH